MPKSASGEEREKVDFSPITITLNHTTKPKNPTKIRDMGSHIGVAAAATGGGVE